MSGQWWHVQDKFENRNFFLRSKYELFLTFRDWIRYEQVLWWDREVELTETSSDNYNQIHKEWENLSMEKISFVTTFWPTIDPTLHTCEVMWELSVYGQSEFPTEKRWDERKDGPVDEES